MAFTALSTVGGSLSNQSFRKHFPGVFLRELDKLLPAYYFGSASWTMLLSIIIMLREGVAAKIWAQIWDFDICVGGGGSSGAFLVHQLSRIFPICPPGDWIIEVWVCDIVFILVMLQLVIWSSARDPLCTDISVQTNGRSSRNPAKTVILGQIPIFPKAFAGVWGLWCIPAPASCHKPKCLHHPRRVLLDSA